MTTFTVFAILGFTFGLMGLIFGTVGFGMAISTINTQRKLNSVLEAHGIDLSELQQQASRGPKITPPPATPALTGGLSTSSLLPGTEPSSDELARRELYQVPQGSQLRDEVETLLLQDKKIAAIKRVREATGAGLKEAKDTVERIERGW